MNIQDYRNVMDQLKPAPSLEARIKEQLGQSSRRSHPRRLAGKIAVAVLAAACTFMAAMAVSPQLRAAVLTFFQLEETEQVPPPDTTPVNSAPSMTQDLIAQQVEAQYIRLPGLSGYDYGNGVLFQTQLDDYGAILDFRYWAAEGNTLVPLETHTTDFTTTWDGITYTDTVYWCVYDGALSCYCNGKAGMAADADCVVSTLPGSTDSVILRLSQGNQMGYRQYPVLLDLATGEVTDLLGGTGWEKAAPVREVQWADDLSAAILSNDRMGWFYCDRTAKTTAHLDKLTGLDVFSAYFAPDNSLILLTQSGPEGDCYDIWTWQPDSGVLTQTFSQLHIYRERDDNPYGFQFLFGSALGLYITPEGKLSVLDLCTGQETPVEGFSLTQWDSTFLPNPSGSKILFADYDYAADSLGIARLGVIDLTRGTFTVLDREGYDALDEGNLSWFDEDRVAIRSSQKDDYTECYLYLYQF